MAAKSLKIYEVGETFYVPRFTLTVGGKEVQDQVIHDVLEVKYSDSLTDIDSFEIRLNNWDAATFGPRYEPPSKNVPGGLFDPGNEVTLAMGYGGKPRPMISGVITTLEPSFPASGALTLSVRGLNVLHRFRTEQHSWAWEKKTESRIAEELGGMPAKEGKPGLGIKVKTAPVGEKPLEYVFMDNQYDIVFLMQRARRLGYELLLKKGNDGSEYLYFGPSGEKSEPPAPYVLEWGRSLASFTPTLSTATQISEVVVRGWDRRTHKLIEGKATWEDLVKDPAEKARMKTLAKAFGDRREIVTDQPVHNEKEAKTRAERLLSNKLKTMVEARGSVVGLPDLRAGRRVEIARLGPRFDGEYFVTETTHTIGEGGYKVDFKARRENGPQLAGGAA